MLRHASNKDIDDFFETLPEEKLSEDLFITLKEAWTVTEYPVMMA